MLYLVFTSLKSESAYNGHCSQDFKRTETLITWENPDQVEIDTRRTEEIARMDANIIMSLETEEFIQKDTDASRDAALSFEDMHNVILAIENRTIPIE